MANNPQEDDAFLRHLDTSGEREVVYCHECHRQWYRNAYGMPCPGCGGEFTEIVSDEFDPRPPQQAPRVQRPPTPPGFTALRGHNPWGLEGDSDPDEEDITEHLAHGPGNNFFFTRTAAQHGPPRRPGGQRPGVNEQDFPTAAGNFQDMIGNLLGPEFRAGQPGRSGPDDLFNQHRHAHEQRVFGGGRNANGISYTFTTTSGVPRTANGQQGDEPQLNFATLLGGLFNGMAPGGAAQGGNSPGGIHPGMPPGLQGLLAQILNPANARSGDAVYTQEAMDAIITDMMNQHGASTAPGPAAPEAIAALPKKKLDEAMLGPEGKGECSVCMDDVVIGDEVVALPCSHWFHEHCAEMWLKQHNTCPICRKGLGGSEASPGQNSQSGVPRTENLADRLNRINRSVDLNSRPRNAASSPEARAARLQSIRNLAEFTSPDGSRRVSISVSAIPLARPRLDGSARSGSLSSRDPTPAEASSMSHASQAGGSRRSDSQRSVRPRNVRPSESRRSSQTSNTENSRRGSQTVSENGHAGNDSRRGSQASGSSTTTGAFGWIRDRFGGGGSSSRR